MSKNFIFPAITAILLLSTACSNRPDSHNRQPGNEQVKESDKKELPAGAIGIKYNRHIYCEVMLHDSIPARMIFDTGCSTLVLDSTFYADTFGKERKLQSAMLGGAGDGYEQAYIDRNCWKYSLGKESMTEEMATVLNLRKIVGDNADGMFGMMFMQGKRVEINYADNYMCFLTAEEEIGEDFTRIPFTLDGMRIVLPLAITMNDGNVFNGKFLMDTGMPGTLSLNSTTADRLMMDKHLADARCMSYSVGGIGGDSQEFMFKTPRITVGGHAIKDLMITWSSNKEGALANAAYDGLIGNELFDRFDVILDFVDNAVYLRPNKNFDRPEPNFLGVALTPMKDHWIVNGILEGGNAEKAGLRRGDRIETINGIKANESNAESLYPLPDKLTLTVRREDGIKEIVVYKESFR